MNPHIRQSMRLLTMAENYAEGGGIIAMERDKRIAVGVGSSSLFLTIEEARALCKLLQQLVLRTEQRIKLAAKTTPAAPPQERKERLSK